MTSLFKITVAALLLVAVTLSGSPPALAQASGGGRPAHVPTYTYQPDLAVRSQVRGIQPRQAASIEFSDLPYGMAPLAPYDPYDKPVLHPSFAPVVTDQRLIRLFLRGLHHASEYTGVLAANAMPSLRINFRRVGQHQRDPLDIEFNQADFGPEFWSVMQTLPRYLTEQLHRRLHSIGPQVREVDFVGLKVNDRVKVSRIIRGLEQVNEGAFEVWSSDYNFEIKLLLGRHSADIILSTVPPPGSRKSPLPGVLSAYYNRVERASKTHRPAGAITQ